MGEEKRYLLVRPKYFATVASVEPLALEYLAAILEKNNKRYEVLDEFVHSYAFRFKRLAGRIRKQGYNVVCFSTPANKAHYVLATAKRLKAAFPHLVIFLGGAEVTLNPGDFFLDGIDVVYYDHGLTAFEALVQADFAPQALAAAPGTAWNDGGNWHANPAGPPVSDYHVLPNRQAFYACKRRYYIIGKGRFALLKTSFSCPQACSFCVSRLLNGAAYLEREEQAVLDELEGINCDKVWIIDDDFLVDRRRVERFCRAILQRGIKKLFMVFARADSILALADLLPLLRQAGFRDMLVGLEAVEDAYLAQYNKNATVSVNEQAVDLLRQNHIVCNGLFVMSQHFSGKDFGAVHRFIKRKKLTWVLFSILTPYKGSALYDQHKHQLHRYEYKRLGGTRIILPPTKLPFWRYYLHFNMLYVRRYPKLYWATLTGRYNKLVADDAARYWR